MEDPTVEQKNQKRLLCPQPIRESGIFHKGEHKRCFYMAHTVCDRHNFILDTVITSGNVHDSVAFDDLYERVTERFPEIKIITMDAGYKTPWICKRVIEDGRLPSLPYKRADDKGRVS